MRLEAPPFPLATSFLYGFLSEQRDEQTALYPYLQSTFVPGILPAHAGFFSHFPSVGGPSVSLCEDISEVRGV